MNACKIIFLLSLCYGFNFAAFAQIETNCINTDLSTAGTGTIDIGQSFKMSGCSGGFFHSIEIEKSTPASYVGTLTIYNGQSDAPADQLYQQTDVTLSGDGFQSILLLGGSGSLTYTNGAHYTFVYSGLTSTFDLYLSSSNPYAGGEAYFGGFYPTHDISFRINTINSDPLPIELLSFTVQKVNGAAELHWSTASEFNNAGFEVQRSSDGLNFETIHWVNGHGTTKTPHKYVFVDYPPPGKSYYRLKQVDYDGKYNFSWLAMFQSEAKPTLYPNPTSGKLNIPSTLPYPSLLRVFTFTGKLVLQEETVSGQVDLSSLPSGMYIIEVHTEQEIYKQIVFKR